MSILYSSTSFVTCFSLPLFLDVLKFQKIFLVFPYALKVVNIEAARFNFTSVSLITGFKVCGFAHSARTLCYAAIYEYNLQSRLMLC
jgi:hypothetical protein